MTVLAGWWRGEPEEVNRVVESKQDGPLQAEFPIERLITHTGHRFQRGFATQAIGLFEASEAFAFLAVDDGLLIRGENEEALATPVDILRQAHGPALHLQPPRVRHLLLEGQWCEPVMQLRVQVLVEYLGPVRQHLLAAGARVLDVDVHLDAGVIRAEAPLARLLGLGEDFKRLTEGRGTHWIWLDRYAPLDTPPEPGAA